MNLEPTHCVLTPACSPSRRKAFRLPASVLVPIILALVVFTLHSCSFTPAANRSVTFVAILKGPAVGEKAYLTGNNSELGNWNPSAVPMTRQSDTEWSVTIPFKDGEAIEYKITAGSWWTEALAENEDIYHNLRLKVKSDTVIYVQVYYWRNKMAKGRPVLTADRFRPARPYFNIDGLWRYHPGDNPAWYDSKYDDSSWEVTDSYIRWTQPSQPHWNGLGWFRFHIYVDSSLWNTTLAIRIHQLGASQIYYDGRLLYSFGKVGSSSSNTTPNAMSWWQQFKVDPQYDQLFAVRYADYDSRDLMKLGYYPGFVISLKDLNTAFREAGRVRVDAVRQTVFTLIPLILFFIHLSLYGFMRKQRQNLYYAICMLGFAGITYFNYEQNVIVNVNEIILLTKLSGISVAVAIFFGLLTSYEMTYVKLPKRFWLFLGMFCLICLTVIAGYSGRMLTTINYVFFALTFLEIVAANFRRNEDEKEFHGGWIVLAGFSVMSIFIILQILLDYSVIPSLFGTGQAYAYGMMCLAVSMSVFLSYNFARVNRDLETQLVNVKQLSEKAIEQERTAHKLDLERKAIEVENERQTKELESARELQLSLLPKVVPKMKGLDIAAFMKTATEVGGDYYDFFVSGNGDLTVALGDATGHGLRAGNMVTATKGLLNILSGTEEIKEILVRANRAIKQMDLHMLTMCLAVARIVGNKLWYTSAGMPPLLVYRAQSGQCEQHVLKAMPLGTIASFPYESSLLTLSRGDAIVMASDGLIEMFDGRRETYGIENTVQSFKTHAAKEADKIVQGLWDDAKSWAGDMPLADDLTIVVVKMTEERID